MRGVASPVRSVLVVAATPHPWALLRDRLDPELADVRWAAPDQAEEEAGRLRPWPWAVAGDAAGLAKVSRPGRPVLRFEVSSPAVWPGAAEALDAALARRAGGVSLAPARGLRLPGGGLLLRVPELEALLGAGPDGLALDAPHRRRARQQLRRLPVAGLGLGLRAGRLVLEVRDVDAA